METVETAVIGAGAAGLAAFERLAAAGRDVVLLEARDRIGGRVWTLQPDAWPLPVELGAEFIHGAPHELVPFAVDEPLRRNWRAGEGGLRPVEDFGIGADAIFARMARLQPPAEDRSFAGFLAELPDVPPATVPLALGYVEGYEAADPERISVQSLNREWAAESEADSADAPGPRRVRGGYTAVLEAFNLAGPVWLNTVVQSVRWRRGRVELDMTRDGQPLRLAARQAIVTLPLSVLQQSEVQFDPPLEAKRAALEHLAMGGALRVILRLKSRLWETVNDEAGDPVAGLGFLLSTAPASGHFPTWWTSPAPGSTTAQITGWAAGRHAWALAGQSREAIIERALADLAAALRLDRQAIEAELVAAHTHDWQSDPYSLGAYSYACVGGLDAPGELARPLEATLFFAGEATENHGRHATVQGAIRSGRRAAEEVLAGG